jgi:hypothetical protein
MSLRTANEWLGICVHLILARSALDSTDPRAQSIEDVKRNLTPGDSQWTGDDVLARVALEAIVGALLKSPMSTRPASDADTDAVTKPFNPEFPAGIRRAIGEIDEAIKLLTRRG